MRRALVVAVVLCLALGAEADAGTAPTVSARLTPVRPLFGDTASYVVEATFDPAALDTARIIDPVVPFTRIAPARITRTTGGGVGHIRVTETIACLSAPCAAGKRGVAIALPAARVVVAGSVTAAPRVEVKVGSRVTDAAARAAKPVFSRPAELPRPTYRLSPGAGELVLALLGLALVAVGVVVLTAPLRRVRAATTRKAVDADPRRRAARLLRESVAREASDRRRAASLAARVVPEPGLAGDAAAVAWSRPEPLAPDAVMLADRVEQTSGSERE